METNQSTTQQAVSAAKVNSYISQLIRQRDQAMEALAEREAQVQELKEQLGHAQTDLQGAEAQAKKYKDAWQELTTPRDSKIAKVGAAPEAHWFPDKPSTTIETI